MVAIQNYLKIIKKPIADRGFKFLVSEGRSSVAPEMCWVLENLASHVVWSVSVGSVELLLTFTSEKKANAFLWNMDETSGIFVCEYFLWDDLVKKFSKRFDFVAIDETGDNEKDLFAIRLI